MNETADLINTMSKMLEQIKESGLDESDSKLYDSLKERLKVAAESGKMADAPFQEIIALGQRTTQTRVDSFLASQNG